VRGALGCGCGPRPYPGILKSVATEDAVRLFARRTGGEKKRTKLREQRRFTAYVQANSTNRFPKTFQTTAHSIIMIRTAAKTLLLSSTQELSLKLLVADRLS